MSMTSIYLYPLVTAVVLLQLNMQVNKIDFPDLRDTAIRVVKHHNMECIVSLFLVSDIHTQTLALLSLTIVNIIFMGNSVLCPIYPKISRIVGRNKYTYCFILEQIICG